MIGADYEKIQFTLAGLNLLEPMALITDTILGALFVYLGYRVHKFGLNDEPFYRTWRIFFFVFGIGAFLGGLGHGFYNYWGIIGKMPSWLAGPISIYLIERAMILAHINERQKKLFLLLSNIKMVIVYIVFFVIICTLNVAENNRYAFMPIAINTILGVVMTAGVLGFYLSKKVTIYYRYFFWGVVILFPSAFLFLFKINLHQWFDKNDFAHVLMGVGISYFYLGAKKVAQFEGKLKS